MALLETLGIVAGYGGSAVLHEVSLGAEPGRITGIIGPNGAGKSTFLKVLMGFLHPNEGEVRLEGESILEIRPEQRIRLGMAYVAQTESSFAALTVQENLRLGAYLVREKSIREERMEKVFRRFPALEERRKQLAGVLSGGERRMLEIGRFLMMEPHMVLLDEPSIGLAPQLVEMVYEQIHALRSEGMTFLVVEQNVRKLLGVADYVYALEAGSNRYEGTPKRLTEEGRLAGLYLGAENSGGDGGEAGA